MLLDLCHSWRPSNSIHITNFWIQESEKPTDSIPVLQRQLSAYQETHDLRWFESIETVRYSPYTFKLQSFGARYNMVQYDTIWVCDGLWVLSSSPTALPMSVIFCASGMCLITASEDATLLGDSETRRLGSEKLTLWMGSSSDAWHTSCNIRQHSIFKSFNPHMQKPRICRFATVPTCSNMFQA